MSSLVEDLLLLARLDAGRPLDATRSTSPGCCWSRSSTPASLAPAHRWQLDLPDEPVTVTGDEQRLHQVVTNLLGNARHHTPPGTTVTVSAAAADDGVRIVVHDDGPGLPGGPRGERVRAVHPRRRVAHPRLRRRRSRAVAGRRDRPGPRRQRRVESQLGSTTFTVAAAR